MSVLDFEHPELVGQPPRRIAEHVAERKDARDRRYIVDGPRRTNLHGKTPARFFVRLQCRDCGVHVLDRTVMQCTSHLLDSDAVTCKQSAIDVVAEGVRLRGHQIAADPLPNWLERNAGDPTQALMIGRTVGQKRLQRHEEASCGIADPRHRLRAAPDHLPQLLEHQFAAGNVLITQQGQLELRDQHRSGCRRQGLQVFPQPYDG